MYLQLYELFYKVVFDDDLFIPYCSLRSSSFQAGYSNIKTAYLISYSIMHACYRKHRVSSLTEKYNPASSFTLLLGMFNPHDGAKECPNIKHVLK